MTKIGFGITGSFCNHEFALKELRNLVNNGYDVYPIVTFNTYNLDGIFSNSSLLISFGKNH